MEDLSRQISSVSEREREKKSVPNDTARTTMAAKTSKMLRMADCPESMVRDVN